MLILAILLAGWSVPHVSFAATAEEATVNIYCFYKSGNKTFSSTGTGFFISERGVILTNAHVVEPFLVTGKKGGCTIRTGSPARDAYTADILYLSPTWATQQVAELKKKNPRGTGEGDFALLYVTGAANGTLPAAFPALPFDESAAVSKEPEEVTIAGYPVGKSFKTVAKKLAYSEDTTTVSGVRYFVRPYPDVLTLSPSQTGTAGASGGPVIDAGGSAEAIITAVENGAKKGEQSIRAITLFHVNRTLLTEAGTLLRFIIAEDLPARAAQTRSSLTDELRKDVTKALFSKR